MELQNGAIIFIIILLSFVLIGYAVYLIHADNVILKNKINEVYGNVSNLETNINNFFTQHVATTDEDEDEYEEIEYDNDETDYNKPSLDLFANSNEELEYLRNFQSKIQGDAIIKEIIDHDADTELDSEGETEHVHEEENEHEAPEISITEVPEKTKCPKILTHGKRKGEECEKPVSIGAHFCKLHL